MGLQLSRKSGRRFGDLLLEQLYGIANVAKPAPDPLGHALRTHLAVQGEVGVKMRLPSRKFRPRKRRFLIQGQTPPLPT